MNEEQLQQKQSKRMHRFLASVFTKFSYQIEHSKNQFFWCNLCCQKMVERQIFATTCNLMLGFLGWWSAHMTKIFFFLNLRKNNLIFVQKDTIYRKPGFCEYDFNEILKEIPY